MRITNYDPLIIKEYRGSIFKDVGDENEVLEEVFNYTYRISPEECTVIFDELLDWDLENELEEAIYAYFNNLEAAEAKN